MKSRYLIVLSLITIFLGGCNNYQNSISSNHGVAASSLAGAILKSKDHPTPSVKYKRKDCPVCKGKGWYMSGDGIEKIACQYCEPEKLLKAEKSPIIIKR